MTESIVKYMREYLLEVAPTKSMKSKIRSSTDDEISEIYELYLDFLKDE